MIFQVFSDIHIELMNSKNTIEKFCQKFPLMQNSNENYLILAGDIGNVSGENFKIFIKFCSENYKDVFYVLGNHEYYSSRSIDNIKLKFQELFSSFLNVHLLDNSYLKIGDYTIYGFTCWTRPIFDVTSTARDYLNDYNKIKTKNGRFTVTDHLEISNLELAKFKEFYENYNSDKLIVITHFPPISFHSDNDQEYATSNPKIAGNFLTHYFSWNNIFESENINPIKIKAWISGHTHWSYNFMYQNVKLFSNQIGYRGENVNFSDGLLEIV